MVSLDIAIQWGQIGIQHIPFQVDMDIKSPDMILKKRDPELQLQVTFPYIVEIDQRACFREIGLLNFLDIARQEAQEGQANVLQAIERYAQKGDRLARIENKDVTIAQVASEVPERPADVNIDVVPKSRPDITFQEGDVRGDLVYGDVETRLNPGNLGYTSRQGRLEFYMEKEPYIRISAKGQIFDDQA